MRQPGVSDFKWKVYIKILQEVEEIKIVSSYSVEGIPEENISVQKYTCRWQDNASSSYFESRTCERGERFLAV